MSRLDIKIKKFFGIILILVSQLGLQGQDYIFSQPGSYPMLLNPALTGNIEGNYRFIAIARQQWLGLGSEPVYQTPSASADFNVGKGPHTWGLGLLIANDKSAGGALNDLLLLSGLSFHLALDENERHYLSLGFQGGWRQLRINPSKLGFGDQFDGTQINLQTASGEVFENDQAGSPEFRAGLNWSMFSKKWRIKAGAAIFNFLEPEIGFLGQDFRRRIITGNGEIKYQAGTRIWLLVEAVYRQHAGVDHFLTGALIGFNGNEKQSGVAIGAAYRSDDSLIGRIQIRFRSFTLFSSYDYSISDLGSTVNTGGTLELGLSYTGRILSKPNAVLPAIRFY